MKKRFIQGAGLYLSLLGILWLFLIAAAIIPNNLIQENMKKSALIIGREPAFVYCDGDKMNGIADNYADSIWMNVAWYMGKGNPILSSVNTWYYDGEQAGENVGLYQAVTQDTTKPNTDYTRYWQGTAGVIRILHVFMDVTGIRNLGFLTTLFLAAVLMILLIKNGKDLTAVLFFISLCIIKIWNIRLSMEYQPAFIIGFLMCILYLLFEKKGDNFLLPLAIVGGEVIAFFDFLTTETVVILLPLILVITVRALEGRIGETKENIKFILNQGIAWGVSYGMTFVMKWILVSVIMGENRFFASLGSAKERMNGVVMLNMDSNIFTQTLTAPAANLSILFGGTERIDHLSVIAGILLVLVFAVISIWYIVKTKGEKRAVTIVLCFLGSMILVRYMVLSNHSYLHAFFTYRGLISMIMALSSILLVGHKK